jgi:GntR family transcriptional repressor for pyruvate dehydrogenase complex
MIDHTIVGNLLRGSASKSPIERVIRTIKDFIHTGKFMPGDRLPSESVFQHTYEINRHHLRQALQELEVYGIVKIIPQSGTYLTNFGPKALELLIDNLLNLNEPDFYSLADTRSVLEIRAAELSAQNAEDSEIDELQTILQKLRREVENGKRGVEEDYAVHLKIAQMSKSNMLTILISMIVPLCLEYSQSLTVERFNIQRAFSEHEVIVQAIQSRDPERAAAAMKYHMEQTRQATLSLMGNLTR